MNVRLALLALLAGTGSVAGVACVLADPPPIVTPPPLSPPSIIEDSVSPPLFQTIPQGVVPCVGECFSVPVIVDPNASVKYRVFVDLDPTATTQQGVPINSPPIVDLQDDGGVLAVSPEAGPGKRILKFGISSSLTVDFSQCHTFTFVVAYDFFPDNFAKPIPPGGSSATWFYQPIADCNYYDGGPPFDASVSDGSTD